jgi:hypothetical protein
MYTYFCTSIWTFNFLFRDASPPLIESSWGCDRMMIGRWGGSSFDNELHHKKLQGEPRGGQTGFHVRASWFTHIALMVAFLIHSWSRIVALYRRWWLGRCSTNAVFNNVAVFPRVCNFLVHLLNLPGSKATGQTLFSPNERSPMDSCAGTGVVPVLVSCSIFLESTTGMCVPLDRNKG